MMGKYIKLTILSLLLLTSIAALLNTASAYDDATTHPKLTDIAARASNMENCLIQSLALKDGFNTKLPPNSSDNIIDLLSKGSIDEDHHPGSDRVEVIGSRSDRVRSLLLTFAFHNSFSAFSRFISVNQEY